MSPVQHFDTVLITALWRKVIIIIAEEGERKNNNNKNPIICLESTFLFFFFAYTWIMISSLKEKQNEGELQYIKQGGVHMQLIIYDPPPPNLSGRMPAKNSSTAALHPAEILL